MREHSVDGSALVAMSLAIFLVPLQWIAGWLVAVTLHEVCHYLAVRACGGTVRKLRFGFSGVRMEVCGSGWWQEVLCALAGPVGGAGLVFVGRWFPRTAVCALALSLFNLLPVYPLDGGRALRGVVCGMLPVSAAQTVCDVLQRACILGLAGLGAYAFFFLDGGLVSLVISVLLAVRLFPIKRPCISVPFSIQ